MTDSPNSSDGPTSTPRSDPPRTADPEVQRRADLLHARKSSAEPVAQARQARLEAAAGLPPESSGGRPPAVPAPRTEAMRGSPISGGPGEGPLIREDPALSPTAHAIGITGVRLAAHHLGGKYGDGVKVPLEGLANAWEAKVTSDPEATGHNMVTHVVFGAATGRAEDKLEIKGLDPNIEGSLDQARDRMDEVAERRAPKRRPEGETP